MSTILYCFHCKRPVGVDKIAYEDIQSGHTLFYHSICWMGAVKRNVVDEYIDLICRVAGHHRIRRKP